MSPTPTVAATPSVDVPSVPPVVSELPKPVAAAVVDPGRLPGRLVDLYKLSEIEARLLSALLAAKTTLSVAELAQEFSLPLTQVLALLGPEGLLRGCALVELAESAELGWAVPHDLLRAGRGLHLICSSLGQPATASDDLMPLSATLPGLSVLSAPAPGSAWVQELLPNSNGERPNPAIADLVREQLVATQPVLLCLGGGSAEQLSTLAQQARLRLQRPVVTLDATALAGWPLPLLVPALRRLRRDSDVRGAVLLVREASALGAGLRSLLRPRPPGQTAPLILCSDGAPLSVGTLPPALRGEQAWTVVSLALRGANPTAPPPSPAASLSSAGKTADVPEENEDPAVSASRQEARRQAAIDAARAMGRPVPKELMTPPAAAPAPAGSAATTPGAAGPRPASSTPSSSAPPGKIAAAPAAPAPAAPAPAAAPPPAERPSTSDAGPRRTPNPRLAAALAAAGLPPPGSEKYRSGEHAGRRSDAPVEAVAPSPAPAAVPLAPPAAAPVVATPATASDAAPPDPPASPAEGEDAAPLPLEAEAPLEEQLRVARSTPNQAQRAEVLRRLTGARHSAVIQLFRSFVSSPHPAVREAAEGGMSAIFGPSWNRSRQIAPPTQPPRSDDGGRGPGGAF